ncbi:MAG: hypothetical protein H6741_13330 [Alphaproteobacteria bacterium]|nr:hypothetical protein [Alphaproteobacteria bacterium]MCB9793698.1 hypothetical protein [Alphaproteobacteria bacterium]
MAKEEPDKALVVRGSAQVQASGPGTGLAGPSLYAEGPPPVVRQAVPQMLEVAADAFGDLVHTLIHDLEQITATVDELGWLSLTPSLLERESAFKQAVAQMQMWEHFVATLPNPHLFSERTLEQRRKIQRLQARALVVGRERALADHRRLIEAELGQADLTSALVLKRGMDDPESVGWRVDPRAYVAAELAQIPQLPELVPIVAADLHPAQNAAGYNAVLGMRQHPVLGPQAAQLDAALAEVLPRHFKLEKAEAAAHAQALTGIFLLAMMRAMRAGDMELATSVRFVVPADARKISADFGEELLKSWWRHVETLPRKPEKKSLGQRLRGLFGRTTNNETPAFEAPSPVRRIGVIEED